MQRFPTAVHEDWTDLEGVPAKIKDAIREGAGLALTALDGRMASVEAAGFATKDDQLLVRARVRMANLPDLRVWEQEADPAAFEAAGVDFDGADAPQEVAAVLHGLLCDFVDGERKNSEKRHL